MHVKAAVALHNCLRTEESVVYRPSGFIDGEDRNGNHIDGRWRADSDPCRGLNVARYIDIGIEYFLFER